MDELLVQKAQIYALRHQLALEEALGFGIHGAIFVALDKSKNGNRAIKAHRTKEAYQHERGVYERLMESQVEQILEFNVPQIIGFDDDLLVIEMSIVTRPFLLDFAGAYLDSPPKFSDEILAEWEAGQREKFDDRWPKVQEVLAALRALDIYMIDVSPNNIAFLD